MAKQRKVSIKSNGTLTSIAKLKKQSQLEMHSMMEKFFSDQLRDIYYVEKNQIKILGRMIKKATTEELKDIFIEQQEVTQEQLGRLDDIFEIIGKRAQAKKCPPYDGMQEELEDIINSTEDDTLTRDVGLIVSTQKIKHYEIASYGCLTTLSKTYGMEEVSNLLQESLEEENEADQQLSYIAENSINYGAGMEDEDY